MREELGTKLIDYSAKHGFFPDHLESALKLTNVLGNRGDYFGRAMVYEKLSKASFRLVAFGKNCQYDDGFSDDVVVKYSDGSWTNNVETALSIQETNAK